MLVLSLLLIPAYGSVAPTRITIARVQRLWSLDRAAPDTGQDHEYRQLVLHLPQHGRIGFMYLHPRSPADLGRTWFFLQYALAPRQIVQSRDERFVIAIERPGQPSLNTDPSFELVKEMDDGLRLFRRVR